jgi:hypothetical protein
MRSHPAGPEDTQQQDNGTGDLASTTHSRRLSRLTCWNEVQQK